LAKLVPGLMAWLLSDIFDVHVPGYHHARTQDAEVQVLVPRSYHADGMVLFCDQGDHPLLAVVLEVQRGRDPAKRRTWKLYVAHLEAELKVDAALVVYCPDPAVADWYRRMFAMNGTSLSLRPLIFTPKDVPIVDDLEQARDRPALAVLSAICHGRDAEVDAMFPALAAALQSVDPDTAISYYDVVLAGLPQAAQTRWEAFMTTTADHQFISERLRKLVADGEARGETRGEGRAVLLVLEARGVPVPAESREQILASTDRELLDLWTRRAATATAINDVLGP